MLLCMGKLPPICGAEITNQRDADTPSPVYDPTMDPVHIPVPNSCNCDVVPNEKANISWDHKSEHNELRSKRQTNSRRAYPVANQARRQGRNGEAEKQAA
jgi:hypothetical protein